MIQLLCAWLWKQCVLCVFLCVSYMVLGGTTRSDEYKQIYEKNNTKDFRAFQTVSRNRLNVIGASYMIKTDAVIVTRWQICNSNGKYFKQNNKISDQGQSICHKSFIYFIF